MIVISDTTPIISLMKADRLELLQRLYQRVVIPKAVYAELVSNTDFEEEKEKVANCDFISVEQIQNQESVKILRDNTGLDLGESEALVLYEEKNADLLLMDEHKGRSVAKKMEVEHIGTVGILLMAFDEKYLLAEEVRDILKIMLEKDIRLSHNLCKKVLDYVGLEGEDI